MKRSLTLLLFLLCVGYVWGQKDTEFWFAAPEVTQGQGTVDYDRPVTFRISTYEFAATIILSQPANPGFPVQTIFLPPNTSGEISSLFFGINNVECTPANTVLNRGFLMTATTPITAYYEVIGGCQCNPEIFSMKGKNALGKEFYVPFQTYLPNSTNPNHLPIPRSSFNIVATEDGTNVTITPTEAIVGHAAGATFTITLQKGQTWAGEAIGWQPDEHPSGTHIVANKPIAVTIEDDLLRGVVFGGSCSDLMGDQIIPTSKMGKRYIVQKGFLTGTEKAFVVGTTSGTQLKVNGLFAGVVGAGETFVVDIDGGQYFIEATEPVGVLQLTGNGCEVSGEIMPPLDCTGSTSVRFVRPTDEPFWLELTTRAGFEGGFLLNGSPSLIPASAFTVVPGSGGEFVAAVLPFDAFAVPAQFSSIVENTLGKFHAGFLCGAELATGTRFGFFSDFNNQIEVQDSIQFCQGDTVISHGITITKEGLFSKTASNPDGCDTFFMVNAAYQSFVARSENLSFCEGDTTMAYGLLISQSGVYTDTLTGNLGCDTILTLFAFSTSLIPKSVQINFCAGDTMVSYGHVFTQSITFLDTIQSLTACDTILSIVATAQALPTFAENIHLCPGDSVVIAGVSYGNPATITTILPTSGNGCDTLATFIISQSTLSISLPDTVTTKWNQPVALPLQVFASLNTEIQWSPATGLDDPTLQNPTATLTGSLGYQVLVKDSAGCRAGEDIWVFVEIPECERSVYVPNVFSPNDDGQNDRLTAFTKLECISKIKVLRFYDRWGDLVFERYDFPPNDEQQGWDGVFRKKPAPTGVYIYYLELEYYDGIVEKKKGDVTLIR
ncbi:MAG: gliding motility-associated C-terminal domain-containing protein [Phycisphaerae bacterium]|nr:gliding motility-associated C-terminal domain-containing protein [Saprospiraceae bacterium]